MSKEKTKYYLKKLDTEVTDGDIMLFEWYRLVQNSYQRGSLTKLEMKKLFREGSGYES